MTTLAALHLRPSPFDPAGMLQAAHQMRGQQTQEEITRLRMAELQEQMRENRDRRGALEGFRAAGGMANPTALSALSGHPDIYQQAQTTMTARDQANLMRNARDAQRVMGFPEGSPQRNQAYREALDRALQEGRIDPNMHSHYSSQPPTNLFLSNIMAQARALPDGGMTSQEIMEMMGLRQPAAAPSPSPSAPLSAPPRTSAMAPPAAAAAALPPMPAPAAPGVAYGGEVPTDNLPVPFANAQPPAAAVPPVVPSGAAVQTAPAAARPGPAAAQTPPATQRSVQELVAQATPAQRASLALLIAKRDFDNVAKLLQEIEGSNRPPPAGFERDPANPGGLRPIPGGPAEQIAPEAAGRLAFLDTAMARMPDVRNVYERAWTNTERWQNLMAGGASTDREIGPAAWQGEIGIARRSVRAMIEGALRTTSGAAVPESEVQRYMTLFMPGLGDSIETAREKLNMLQEFTENQRRMAMAGRSTAPPPQRTPPPAAASDYRVLGVR